MNFDITNNFQGMSLFCERGVNMSLFWLAVSEVV
jgi:hypothetical protein